MITTRIASLKSIIKNLLEPYNVRRCLWLDTKRLLKQVLTGKRCK